MRYSLIAMAFIAILSSCGKMKQPEFRGIRAIDVGELGLVKSQLKLRLTYFNPNNFTGKMQWAKGEAWIDSVYMGPFRIDTQIVARPLSEFEIPVTLEVDMKQALFLTSSLVKKKKLSEDIWLKIEGKTRAGRSGFYKTLPLKFEGKQKIITP